MRNLTPAKIQSTDKTYESLRLRKSTLGSVASDQHKKVGFEVEPKSVSNILTSDDQKTCKISPGHEFQEIKPSTNQVTFSYSVNWEKSETRWASRWDMYLEVKELLLRFSQQRVQI